MIPNVSQDFINAMKSPIKVMYVKLEIYDSNMKFIREVTSETTRDSLGYVSVTADQPIRRSFTFSLVNKNNEFDFGDSNLIWINKRIKLFVGLKLKDSSIEYVPQGVFILSSPSNSHDFNGKISTIQGHDKGFLYTGNRGKFVNRLTIAQGTNIADAIKTIATENGETLFNFDSGITKTLPYEITYDSNTSRWDAMSELAKLAQCDIYFDVNGYLRLKKIDLNEIDNNPTTWTFTYGDINEKFYAGNVRQLSEENLANHITALGGNGQSDVFYYEIIVDETDPKWAGNPYSIQQIGDILYQHNNGNADGILSSNDDCRFRCQYELMQRLGFIEQLTIQVAPLYILDVNDFIDVEDNENSVTGKYIIKSFQLPLNPQLMSIDCLKYHKVINDWNTI